MAGSSKKVAEALSEVAEKQGGYFTSTQAVAAGYKDSVHGYHVSNGDWEKAYRGIYRLQALPKPDYPEFILWSLWSRDRSGLPQGVFSHETALFLHGLADRPEKIHMTVPRRFRKNCETPENLILYKSDLPDGDIEAHDGFNVTTRSRTCADTGRSFAPQQSAFDLAIERGED